MYETGRWLTRRLCSTTVKDDVRVDGVVVVVGNGATVKDDVRVDGAGNRATVKDDVRVSGAR